MTDQQKANRAWLARWREHRLARRQRALERWYLELDRARATGELYANTTRFGSEPVGFFDAFGAGGDGGGGDGG